MISTEQPRPSITNHLSEDGAGPLEPSGQQQGVLDADAGISRAVNQQQATADQRAARPRPRRRRRRPAAQLRL